MSNEEMNTVSGTTEAPKFPPALLAIAGRPMYEDESESGAGTTAAIVGLVLVVLAFLAWDGYRMWMHYVATQDIWDSIDYSGFAFVLFSLYYLLGQVRANYRFTLTDTALRVEYPALFGTKRREILYEDIYGVHVHKARLSNNVRFRYKWRWYSLTDGRPMMALFYRIPRAGKVPQYGRVMFKADPEFQLGMNEYMPGRIGITEEETTYRVLVDEGKVRDELEQQKACGK